MQSPEVVEPSRLEALLGGAFAETEYEARLQGLARELRATAAPAPASLRARVASLRPAPRRRARLVVALASLLLIGAASAGVLYFFPSNGSGREVTARNVPPAIASELDRKFGAQRNGAAIGARPLLAVPAAADAAQDVNMWIELSVADAEGVSSGAQEAMRITRGLGGVVASSTVATRDGKGQADLRLRIPTGRLEDALVGLSRLGTVTSQRVDTEDLQSRLGQTEGRIEALRSAIKIELARLASGQLSAEEELGARIHLVHLRRRLADVGRLHAAFARQAAMADLSLRLSTPTATTAPKSEGGVPGAADKAFDVLRSAGSVVVFLAIVLSPLLVLLVLASLALRARSRRVEAELLAEPRPGGPSRERSS